MFKKILPLNAILFFRFLGLFLVLPLISIYATSLENSTPLLVGIVIGGYALTQAIFQVPFGILSDRFGRKNLIIFGLIIFLIGSIISYLASDIYTLIFGRLLQGAGAIGSVVSASVSDLVQEEKRAKAMAIVGGTIAMSFAIAMVVGSTVGGFYGVDTLFLVTSVLATISLFFAFKIPAGGKIEFKWRDKENKSFLKDSNILYLFFSSLLQKGIMSIVFMVIPLLLIDDSGEWTKEELWKIYIPAMIFGLLSMGPAVIFGEKRGKPKVVFIASATLFLVVSALLISGDKDFVVLALFIFFIAFNLIEPLIQSMVSKYVAVHEKGRALGYTNSFAYIGTFLGGTSAGIFLSMEKIDILGYTLFVLSLIWFIWTILIKNPPLKGNIYIPFSNFLEQKIELGKFEFIDEWYINRTENLIVIKYKKDYFSEKEIKNRLNIL
jgi:predicted MFS family arabinose efflux permease